MALLIAAATQPVLGATTVGAASAAPDEYAGQAIDWKRCYKTGRVPPGLPASGDLLECGSFRAPRDWANPDRGVDVTIAVSRLRPVSGEAQGSLFTNPGGPGGPGRTLPLFFLQAGRKKLLASQEIVGIDVRGTGDSTNVTCDGQTATGATLDPRDRSEGSTGVILDAAAYTARACQQADELGRFITTEQTVQDLDLLRHLLGRERINWLGYSGGTWLGAYYATYFPERVGRFVLDSNTDFTAPWQTTFDLQALGFQRRFEVDFLPYVARNDSHFHLGTTPEEVRAVYETLRAQLAARPLELEELTVYAVDLDFLLIGTMYTKTRFQSAGETVAQLGEAVRSRDEGAERPSTGWNQGDVATQVRHARELARFGGMLPLAPDAFAATFLSVICNDTPWQGDRQALLADSGRQGEAYPLVGWSTLANPCIFWDRSGPDVRLPDGQGVAPVLMVQTERDPATPIEGARHARQLFAGARMLTVVDEGDHGAYAILGNTCVNDVVEAYLVDGVVPDDGSCPGTAIPPPVPVPDPGLLASPPGGTLQEVLAILTRIAGPLPL